MKNITISLNGEFRCYRPAIATYGSIISGGVEVCQWAPFHAPDLNEACKYARMMFGTGAFAVRRSRNELTGEFKD